MCMAEMKEWNGIRRFSGQIIFSSLINSFSRYHSETCNYTNMSSAHMLSYDLHILDAVSMTAALHISEKVMEMNSLDFANCKFSYR